MLTKSPDEGAREAREYLKKRGFGSDGREALAAGLRPGHGALVRHLTEVGLLGRRDRRARTSALKGDGGQLRDRFYERVMFPIFDLQGRAIAFGGRVIGSGEPKYLNTQDTPIFHKSANMYAIDRAKATITSIGTAIVVEGYTDVIALHEAGLTNAVATLGTALTREHVRLLSRFAKRVVYLFDGDAAGLRAADRASEFIDSSITPEAGRDRVELHVAVLPGGPGPGGLRRASVASMRCARPSRMPRRCCASRSTAVWRDGTSTGRRSARGPSRTLPRSSRPSRTRCSPTTTRPTSPTGCSRTSRRSSGRSRRRSRRARTQRAPKRRATNLTCTAVDTPQLRVERELLDLLLRTPALRPRARFLLSDDLLTDPAHKVIAECIADAAPNATAVEIVGSIQERMPEAASALAGSTLDVSGDG